MRIEYSKRSQKSLTDIPIKMQVKIAKAIEGLTQNPPKGDNKDLRGIFGRQEEVESRTV